MTVMADQGPASERVVAALRAAPDPLTAVELARALGVHPTTVRFHLARLERAGRVAPAPAAPRGRGRPAVRYRAVASDDARMRMIAALADAVAGEGDATARSEAAGARWAAETVDAGVDARASVMAEFARMGFAPEAGPDPGVVLLRACPFLEAARARPDVVCAVHRGLAASLAARAGEPEVRLLPFTPDGCRLELGAPSA